MGRPTRFEFCGACYWVSGRCRSRYRGFVSADDQALFHEILGQVVARYRWNCFAVHAGHQEYHLCLETPLPNLSLGMRQLCGLYSRRYNRLHGCQGRVFRDRFQAVLLEKPGSMHKVCGWISAGAAPGREYDELRQAVCKRRFLGSEAFIAEIEAHARSPVNPSRPSLDQLFAGSFSRLQRDRLIHAAFYEHGYCQRQVAFYLGLDPSAVSRILRRQEIFHKNPDRIGRLSEEDRLIVERLSRE
jgi:hypothetical protein